MSEPRDDLLFGVNPVLEALKAGRPFRRVLIQRGRGGRDIDAIVTATLRSQELSRLYAD